jgi:hypothetical protein
MASELGGFFGTTKATGNGDLELGISVCLWVRFFENCIKRTSKYKIDN